MYCVQPRAHHPHKSCPCCGLRPVHRKNIWSKLWRMECTCGVAGPWVLSPDDSAAIRAWAQLVGDVPAPPKPPMGA